jgi:hypothetical protein
MIDASHDYITLSFGEGTGSYLHTLFESNNVSDELVTMINMTILALVICYKELSNNTCSIGSSIFLIPCVLVLLFGIPCAIGFIAACLFFNIVNIYTFTAVVGSAGICWYGACPTGRRALKYLKKLSPNGLQSLN